MNFDSHRIEVIFLRFYHLFLRLCLGQRVMQRNRVSSSYYICSFCLMLSLGSFAVRRNYQQCREKMNSNSPGGTINEKIVSHMNPTFHNVCLPTGNYKIMLMCLFYELVSESRDTAYTMPRYTSLIRCRDTENLHFRE